jgi:hypothetical protein
LILIIISWLYLAILFLNSCINSFDEFPSKSLHYLSLNAWISVIFCNHLDNKQNRVILLLNFKMIAHEILKNIFQKRKWEVK